MSVKKSNNQHSHEELEEIWDKVPVDYYQRGIKKNFLQRAWHTGKLRIVLHLAKNENVEPKKILDVGCASGWFLSEVAKRHPDAKCVGVDVYKKAIDYGKKRYAFLELIQADAHKLPFPDNSFDLIICTEVLEHVVNPQKVVAEIKRVLSKKGKAIIEMDSGNNLFSLVWHWWTHMRHGVWEDAHIHAFKGYRLEKLIKASGFIIRKKKTFNYTMAIAFLVEPK